jgi:hypothetical protein
VPSVRRLELAVVLFSLNNNLLEYQWFKPPFINGFELNGGVYSPFFAFEKSPQTEFF